ncbi:hypothetical protein, partial [Halocynthiibacter sp.]|uniref:hypothetical protein n=1 Tax=Halocynthiibacter sp. TaxID=1979210 RepID=UPI003C360A95
NMSDHPKNAIAPRFEVLSYLGRDFADSVQLMGLDWACTRQDGFIADQQNGKFCVFQIGE